MAVETLNTTTSALLKLLGGRMYPASVMQVKKLSIALAKQYSDISILLLFFSIAKARPVGNVAMATSGMLHVSKVRNSRQVQALFYIIIEMV
jgi:hypothetical protein